MAGVDSVSYISLKNMKWLYKGEGNANLVITLPHDKAILRFEKCNYGIENISDTIMREKKLKRDVLFYKKIIVPFMGKVFIEPPTLGIINKEEVMCLDKELFNQRPKYRLTKGIFYEHVTVHPDYTYLPPILSQCNYKNGEINQETLGSTYCVEIKPKQGWVYPADRRHPKCTYCLNQYLKIKKKRVLRLSKYCPLDLFSGERSRMKRALRNLLITPQNNLKIFQNGKLIYSDDFKGNYVNILTDWLEPKENGKQLNSERLLDKWSELLTDALLRELSEEPGYNLFFSDHEFKNKHILSEESPLSKVIEPCDWSTCVLPSNCILNRILMMQKLQDAPFSSIYKLFCEKKKIEGDYNYVEKLLESIDPPDLVEKYLLSTTAKDCSIFIALQQTQFKTKNKLHYIEDSDGMSFCMNIGISDIDPKPLSCIEKHYKRDQHVVDTILKYIDDTRQ